MDARTCDHGAVWRTAFVLLAACSFTPNAASDGRLPADAVRGDAAPDATAGPIALVASAHQHADAAAVLVYELGVPATGDVDLLVSVQIGANCGDPATPSTVAVAFDVTPLTKIASVVGTGSCDTMATRTEVWELAGASGTESVSVTLAGNVKTLHSAALAFVGTSTHATPATTSGRATQSSITLPSASGDLVVDFVGQGTQIDNAGPGQDAIFVDNISSSTTLDNTGESTHAGSASVTMSWQFGGADEFQQIAVALHP